MPDKRDIFDDRRREAPGIGQQVSHFEITEMLGEGAMAKVFKATDLTLGRDVALKFLEASNIARSQAQAEELKERFVREAQLMARVTHPHMTQIYEAVLAPNHPFLVMEYLPGPTLADRSEQLPALTFLDICRVAEQIVLGLKFAWDKHQMVHRDLKPGNVMFITDDTIKIVDMGIAKVIGDETSQTKFSTSTGVAVGTLTYMAPEQHLGGHVDHRTDIFALGVMLCELLTFRMPFRGRNQVELFEAKQKGLKIKIERYARGLPEPVTKLIGRMLAADPDARVQSYDEILEELRPAIASLQERSAPALNQTLIKPGATRPMPESPDAGAATVDMMASASDGDPSRTVALEAPPADKERAAPRASPAALKTLRGWTPPTEMPEAPPLPAVTAGGGAGSTTVAAPGAPRTIDELVDCIAPEMKLGRFQIGDLIGKGTAAAVYRATDLESKTPVALKLFPIEDPANTDVMQVRFTTVGEAVCKLAHRGIVQIHELSGQPPFPYMATDLCFGPGETPLSLFDYCRRFGSREGVLEEELVLQIGYLLLEALEHAHSRDVVHGDLRPENILFHYVAQETDYWRLHMKITDWAMPTLLGQNERADQEPAPSPAAGRSRWMSPEQKHGRRPAATGDVYSAGAIILYCLTGKDHLDPGTSPSDFRPDIHNGWNPILRKALRPDPDKRFNSAEDMASFLEAMTPA